MGIGPNQDNTTVVATKSHFLKTGAQANCTVTAQNALHTWLHSQSRPCTCKGMHTSIAQVRRVLWLRSCAETSIKLRGWTEFWQLKSFLQSYSGLIPCPGCTDLCDLDVFGEWATVIRTSRHWFRAHRLLSWFVVLFKANEKDFAGILGKGCV